MIIIMFKGQLGNQLFQYAAAKKIALNSNTELKFDLTNQPYRNGKYGPKYSNVYALKFFNIPEKIASSEEITQVKKAGLLSLLDKFKPYYKKRFVWEKEVFYDPKIANIKRTNIYLRGHFQSWKYFVGIEDIIIKEITLKQPLNNKYQELIDQIKKSNSVSIQIRRGDLLTDIVKKEKPCLSINEYFLPAISYILKRVDQPHFFIFTDDSTWAKENLKLNYPTIFVSRPGMMDYEELILMSLCKHNIIANSTFGWWAAWLNSNPNKIIINPKNWFLNPVRNKRYVQDLIPNSWISL